MRIRSSSAAWRAASSRSRSRRSAVASSSRCSAAWPRIQRPISTGSATAAIVWTTSAGSSTMGSKPMRTAAMPAAASSAPARPLVPRA